MESHGPRDDADELGWLAFRYIANEMTPREVESFEARLGEDQAAREAVAAAVDLAGAVVEGLRSVPWRKRAGRARTMRWIAAAACVVASVAIFQYVHHASDMKALAKAWGRRIGQDPVAVSDIGLLAGMDDPLTADEDDDVTVPLWLLEAVGSSLDSDKREDI